MPVQTAAAAAAAPLSTAACPPTPNPSYFPHPHPHPFSLHLTLSPHHVDLAPGDLEHQLPRPLGIVVLLVPLPGLLGPQRALGQFALELLVGVRFGHVDAFGPLLEPEPEGAGGAVEGGEGDGAGGYLRRGRRFWG